MKVLSRFQPTFCQFYSHLYGIVLIQPHYRVFWQHEQPFYIIILFFFSHVKKDLCFRSLFYCRTQVYFSLRS